MKKDLSDSYDPYVGCMCNLLRPSYKSTKTSDVVLEYRPWPHESSKTKNDVLGIDLEGAGLGHSVLALNKWTFSLFFVKKQVNYILMN